MCGETNERNYWDSVSTAVIKFTVEHKDFFCEQCTVSTLNSNGIPILHHDNWRCFCYKYICFWGDRYRKGKGDLIYSRETEKNIKNRMSVKNLVAVDWNSISLKFNTQKGGKSLQKTNSISSFFCKFIILQHSVKHTHIHTHTHSLSLSHTHTLSLSLTHTHSLSHTHIHTLSLTHSLSLSHTHTFSLSLTNTHTRMTIYFR